MSVRRIALVGLLVPSVAFASCADPPVADLPLAEQNYKLLLDVGIEGSPEQIALDTGAAGTVISTETANRLEILHDFDHHVDVGGVGGIDSALYIGKVSRFDLGPLHLAHQSFPIVDLPMRTAAGAPVAGLLGADILHAYGIEIDIQRGRLVLWPERCADGPPDWAANVTPVAIDLDAGNHILVPIRIGDVNLTGVLDTGAGFLAVTERAALRSGVAEDTLADDPALAGTGVNNRAWHGHIHRFEKLTIAGIGFTNIPAGIVPSGNMAAYDGLGGADALLGVDLLRHLRLFVSYRAHTLYAQPIDRPAAE